MLEVHRESGGFTPWNSCSACLAARSDCIGEDRHNLLNRSDVIPLGPAPWNEICAMSRLLRGMLNIPSEGNLVQRDGSIPLGFTLWNACEG